MKYKIPFYKKVMAFAMLLIFSHSMKICSQTCIDLSKGTTGLYALLQSMWPAHKLIGNTDTEIIAGGSYQVMENIVGSIIIKADDVVVDLNGFTVSGTEDPLIIVQEDQKNIVIKNGSIEGDTLNTGVQVDRGASTVILQDLNVSNCATGVLLSGTECKPVKCCKVDNCFTTSCVKGYVLEFTEKVVFEKCQACCCQESGFDLYRSRFNKFKDCMAIGIGNAVATTDAFGFTSVGGFDNLFYECFAEGIHKDGDSGDGTWCKKVIGFNFGFPIDPDTSLTLINYPEMESKIIRCLVDSVQAPDSSWYHAMGIRLDSVLPDASATDPITAGDAGSFVDVEYVPFAGVDWSPQCDLIAFGQKEDIAEFAGGGLKLIGYDGTSLIDNIDLENFTAPPSTIQFSPNGEFILITYGGGTSQISIYDVKKRMLIPTAIANPGANTPYAAWFNCNNKIVFSGATSNQISVYLFNGKTFTLSQSFNFGGVGGPLAISPDDKFFVLNRSTGDNLFLALLDGFFILKELDDAGRNPVFNPTVCCNKYYIATLVTGDGSILNVSFYNFNGNTLTNFASISTEDQIKDYKWHPSGKYLAVSRNGGNDQGIIEVYRFDPQADQAQRLVKMYEYTPVRISGAGELWIDWSPCGNHLVIFGDKGGSPANYDLEVIELGNCVKCCVVDSNKVANSSGGQCAIGIFGTTCCNGITRNVGYENCVNFSQGVYNKYCNGLSGPHSLLGNWSIPPY